MTPWPDDLPSELIPLFERILARIPDTPSVLSARDRNRDAARLAKAARDLLAKTRQFHQRYPEAIDQGARERAREAAQRLEMDDRESAMFEIGFDPYALQHPLNGLSMHMDAIAQPGEDGRPRGFLQRAVVDQIGRHFIAHGLHVSGHGDALLSRTLEAAFDRKGWSSPKRYLDEWIKI